MVPLIVLLILLSSLSFQALADDSLNVHLICHTHDDVGWLKTVDQYFVGQNNSIQPARVQYIIDSVIDQLLQDPNRRFIYVEMAFFARWWEQQSDARKDAVRRLVKNGQLEFINAGWSMNDEATTYYQAIIDQMTLGHLFLKKEFGFVPRIGWHIDPFGHSATQASLFSDMGFDSFIFWRIDYQDHDQRLADKRTEFLWRGSETRGEQNDIFTILTYDWYGPPPGFCFDGVQCSDDSIQNRKDLEGYNLDAQAELFAQYARKVANAYKGNDIFLTFGGDFRWETANQWYRNLDILMDYFNKPENYEKFKLKLIYSSPSIYTDAKFDYNYSWNIKKGDFMPYADNPHGYWSGFYTSRAALKGFVRYSNAYLQVCKHMEVIRDIHFKVFDSQSSSNLLSESMGIAQHHDAVSGTAKQHVTDDYVKRLASGCSECDRVVSETLNLILFSNISHSEFVRCNYLNISYCSATESGSSFNVVFYNSLGQGRLEYLRIPVTHSNYQVLDQNDRKLLFQIQPLSKDVHRAQYKTGIKSLAKFEIIVKVEASKNSLNVVRFQKTSSLSQTAAVPKHFNEGVLENSWIKVKFDVDSGLLKSIRNKVSKKKCGLKQTWQYYESYSSNKSDDQNSGAYVFRPKSSNTILVAESAKTEVIRGPLVDEVRQQFSDIVSQTVRLYHQKPYVEVEYTLGPINVEDKIGKEYISKFASSLNSKSTFFTDANGREVLKRVVNYRSDFVMNVTEPVAGNYYPVNSRIFLQDLYDDAQLTIVTDRTQGGSSLSSGEIELMTNRRTTSDDDKGVEEPLSEDIVIRGKYWIFFDTIKESTKSHRTLTEGLQNPLFPFFFEDEAQNVEELPKLSLFKSPAFENVELPQNLHLITFQKYLNEKDLILLRIGHLFAEKESSELAVPQIVDLKRTFGVELVEEMSMTANQKLSDMQRLTWNQVSPRKMDSSVLGDSVVRIAPMEIRTYLVRFLEASKI
jgi:lysosomal alpha-mannosidase